MLKLCLGAERIKIVGEASCNNLVPSNAGNFLLQRTNQQEFSPKTTDCRRFCAEMSNLAVRSNIYKNLSYLCYQATSI